VPVQAQSREGHVPLINARTAPLAMIPLSPSMAVRVLVGSTGRTVISKWQAQAVAPTRALTVAHASPWVYRTFAYVQVRDLKVI
jgi:hypothetical protein